MDVVVGLVIALIGGAGGFGVSAYRVHRTTVGARAKALRLIQDAEQKAADIRLKAQNESLKVTEEAQQLERDRRIALTQLERGLSDRQLAVDRRGEELDRRADQLRRDEESLDVLKEELRQAREKQEATLQKIAKLTKSEAHDAIMKLAEKEARADTVALSQKIIREAHEGAEVKAREVLVAAMERMAAEQSSEHTVTTVPLPNDELKGRIIGKEGRNIQALERTTGVDILVDDTPGVIVLSSFDPIRRQVARVALEKLLSDGRIHPARIEEVVAKAKTEIDRQAKKAGERAVKEAGVVGVPVEMIAILGQLSFRTSYSQNVLKHSVEMAQLAGMIAAEVGADVRISKFAALIHDIGKAMTHEIEGQHHHISRMIAEKYGVEEAICHAAEAHHDDIDATTPEAVIVRVVDALSGARPGARGDTIENYAKRMTELENIADTFDGVEKTYAVAAGREVRVLVRPEAIDDLSALQLARSIADKIEATVKYPGMIKVNVIRETRAVEYAK